MPRTVRSRAFNRVYAIPITPSRSISVPPDDTGDPFDVRCSTKLDTKPDTKLFQSVPVVRFRSRSGRIIKSGNASNAAARSAISVWLYRLIVKLMSECRARSASDVHRHERDS